MASKPAERTRADYRKEFGLDCADEFFDRIHELELIVAKRGWLLRKQFNSNWCAFKASSNRAAFGIAIDRGTRDIYLYIKRVKPLVGAFPEVMRRYHEVHDQAEYFLKPGMELESFMPLFELAHRRSPAGM